MRPSLPGKSNQPGFPIVSACKHMITGRFFYSIHSHLNLVNIIHLEQLFVEFPNDKPSVNQYELHPLLPQPDLSAFSRRNGIIVQSYSTLGAGALVNGKIGVPLLTAIAKKHNATLAQVLLAWALAKKYAIIPKCSSRVRLEENWKCQDVQLAEEDVEIIDLIVSEGSAQKPVRFCWNPSTVF